MLASRKIWFSLSTIFAVSMVAFAQAPPSDGVPANSVQRVSEHVYAIVGFPNIAYVVGTRGTLVVDTGMGPKNGAVVVKEAEKLAKGPTLYLTTTHMHPEHADGEDAFPQRTVVIRPRVQQEEMDQHGMEYVQSFMNRSPQFRELLKDVKSLRSADLLYDREIRLDLGGVTARLFWWGAAHTPGDELIFVEGDETLISGDIVQDKLVPNMPNERSDLKNWLVILEKLEPLKPRYIVPDHGALGDGSLIAKQKDAVQFLLTRSTDLKKQGIGADAAGQQIAAEFKTKFPDWPNVNGVNTVVHRVYDVK